MAKRMCIYVFRALLAGMLFMNLGCAVAVGSAISYGISSITRGLEAGKGADTAVDCPSCIKVKNLEEAKRIREQLRRDDYSKELPRLQSAPQQNQQQFGRHF